MLSMSWLVTSLVHDGDLAGACFKNCAVNWHATREGIDPCALGPAGLMSGRLGSQFVVTTRGMDRIQKSGVQSAQVDRQSASIPLPLSPKLVTPEQIDFKVFSSTK